MDTDRFSELFESAGELDAFEDLIARLEDEVADALPGPVPCGSDLVEPVETTPDTEAHRD